MNRYGQGTPFYSGDALSVIDRLPVVQEQKPVAVASPWVQYLPLIMAAVALALVLYLIVEQNKNRARR